MTKLSPAAYKVLSAVTQHEYSLDPEDVPQLAASISSGLSAALRAAVDQVVTPALEEEFHDRNHALPLKRMVEIRQKLNAIASELKRGAS